MEEDDIVKSRYGNTLVQRERERERRIDKEGRAASPRSL
jgi:hypothetical protein